MYNSLSTLKIIDIRNPSFPDEVDRYATADNIGKVVVYGDYVYVADGDGGLYILEWHGSTTAQ